MNKFYENIQVVFILILLMLSHAVYGQVSLSSSYTDVTCKDANDGTFTVNILSGPAPYTVYLLRERVPTADVIQEVEISESTYTFTNIAAHSIRRYYVVVEANNGTWNETSRYFIVEPADPLTVNAGLDVEICVGQSTVLGGSPSATGGWNSSYSYSWSPVTGLDDPTSPNPTANPTTSQTYTLTVTDANGCVRTDDVLVTVHGIPTQPNPSNNGPLCVGGQLQLFVGTVANATYNWTGPNGFSSTDQNPVINNVTAAHAGTYSLTVTVNGCTSTAGTTNVTINNIPTTPTPSNNGPVCIGGTIELSTLEVSGATYSWTGPNGFTSTGRTPFINNATMAEAGEYSVTVTVNNCTSAPGNTNVVVIDQPATPTASNDGPVCENGTLTLNTGEVNNATYSWRGPNGFTSNDRTPVITNITTADAGLYFVSITIDGCTSDEESTEVVVNPIPAQPMPTNDGPVCERGTLSLFTDAVAGATYSWTGPNGFTSSEQNPQITNVTAADAGNYSVTITVNNCTSTAGTTNVVVNTVPNPTPANNGPLCEGDLLELTTPEVIGATYSWTGPNGFTSALREPTISNVNASHAGAYNVTVTLGTCTSLTESTTVVINTKPATPAPSNNGPVCVGGTLDLTGPAVVGATYNWTGPNGFSSTDQNPVITNITAGDAGTYSLTVTVGGCTSDPGTTEVVVNPIPADPNPSNNGPVCERGTLNLFTDAVAGATYSWTGPNGFSSTDQNPVINNVTTDHAGNYSVTVTLNGCTSATMSTNVVVNSVATPSPQNNGPLCEGDQLELTTDFVAGATYSWTGPNGFSSNDQNPIIFNVTTANSGTYSLIVSVGGCSSLAGETEAQIFVIPTTPVAGNEGDVCEGETISLNTDPILNATYNWTGPNGFTSNDQNPTIANATLAMAGTYSVTVTVNGCTSDAGTTDVVVNPIPATPDPSNDGPVCERDNLQLSADPVPGAVYNWTGPNGFTSNDQSPFIENITAAHAGNYFLTITVDGCTSVAGSTTVVVNSVATPAPTNNGPLCVGSNLQLSTTEVAGATYSWTGPNGFTSTVRNPVVNNVTTADAGAYQVTVTVGGCTSLPGSTNVVVNPIPTTPNPSNNGPVCAGENVTIFTGFVAGATYSWTGPDGFTSTSRSNTINNVTAAKAGIYRVTVTVNGCTSAEGTTEVEVNTVAPPTANNDGPLCVGDNLMLTTLPVAGATYNWTGPNGFTSTEQNPIINNVTTAHSGAYSVSITLDGCTSQATSTNVVVNPIPAQPDAFNNEGICEGETIELSTPTVAGATYSWTGPNGFASNDQNPVIPNSTADMAGIYSVTVSVNGCTSPAGTTDVVLRSRPAIPNITENGPLCEGDQLQLGTDAVAGATYSWTGPNGFTSTEQNPVINNVTADNSGVYSLTITVDGCASAAQTSNVIVNVQPVASYNGPLCEGDNLELSTPTVAGATYSWTGPNGFTSTEQNPVIPNIALADAGTYSVIVSIPGCTSSPGDVNVQVFPVPAQPNASNNGELCERDRLDLSTSTVAGATYNWTGPNGFSSTDQNPVIENVTADMAGNYFVTVTVNGCTSDAGVTNVVINSVATPLATNDGPICEGDNLTLSTDAVVGATYSWTGPNGFTSALQNPVILGATVANSGTYEVVITVDGCSSLPGSTQAIIHGTPNADNSGPFCVGETIQLTTPDIPGATYSWTGPNGFASNDQNPQIANATEVMAGTYSLIVEADGCISPAGTTDVVVYPIPAPPLATNTGAYCIGEDIELSASEIAGASYNWSGPGGYTSTERTPIIPSATIAMAGVYSVTVTVNGCTSAASTTNVTVNSIGTPIASNNGPVCEGGTFELSVEDIAGATYTWTGPNGFTSNDQNPILNNVTPDMAGNYSVTAHVNGCASETVETEVVINTAPADVTASNNGPACIDGTVQLSTPLVVGATYSWTGPNGFTSSEQNPVLNNVTTDMAGIYSVIVTTAEGCVSDPGETEVIINIVQEPVAGNDGPVCEGGSIQLTAEDVTNATYSWTGPNGFTSSDQNPVLTNVTASMAGNYSVIVIVDGCASSPEITNVVINNNTAAEINAPASICVNDDPITLTATVGGGTFSGTGVNGNQFNPSGLTVGDYDITYSYTNDCGNNEVITTITVTENAPVVTLNSFNPVCAASAPFALTGGAPAGGTYEVDGVAMTDFDPAAFGVGTYTVVYTFTDNCGTGSAQQTIQVTNDSPVVTLNSFSPVCTATPAFTLTGGSPAGGTYEVDGVAMTNFDPAAFGVGTYTVVYTFSNDCGTNSAQRTIQVTNDAPVVSYSGFQPVCVNAPAFNLTGGTPAGGTYRINGVQATTFNPAAAGAGTHTITYSFSNACGTGEESAQVTVLPSSDPSCGSQGGEQCGIFNIVIDEKLVSCNSDDDGEITVTVTGGTPSYTVEININGQNIRSEQVNGVAFFNNLTVGAYSVRVTDANQTNCTSVVHTLNKQTSITAQASYTENTACDGQLHGRSRIDVTGGNPPYYYKTNLADDWTPFIPGVVSGLNLHGVPWVLVANTVNDPCPYLANVEQLTSSDTPVTITFDVTKTDIACFGEEFGSVIVSNIVRDAMPFRVYLARISENEPLFTSGQISSNTYTFTGVPKGEYNIYITQNQVACDAVRSGNVPVIINEPGAPVTFQLGEVKPSFPDRPSGSIKINDIAGGTGGPYMVYVDRLEPLAGNVLDWTMIERSSTSLKFEYTITDLDIGIYRITISDENDCDITFVQEIGIDLDIFIPNVFTPNGDAFNETFTIRNLNLTDAGNKLVITNRSGTTVYSSMNYQNNWRGEDASGKPLPDGVYFYRLQTAIDNKVFTGYIEIWRGTKP